MNTNQTRTKATVAKIQNALLFITITSDVPLQFISPILSRIMLSAQCAKLHQLALEQIYGALELNHLGAQILELAVTVQRYDVHFRILRTARAICSSGIP